jgi:hypothetical protein
MVTPSSLLTAEERLNALIDVNITDMLDAFGLKNLRRGRRLVTLLCTPAARSFAQKVLRLDHIVGRQGLQAGGWWGLREFTTKLKITGQEYLPTKGPLLLLSNHPGMADTLVLFASVARSDVRIVAASRPFLELLPNISQRLILIDERAKSSTAPIRTVVGHLRAGGAVITFPAGKIEPDPAICTGVADSLPTWSTSIDLFARLAPETQMVPTLISGVVSPRAQNSPLRHLRRTARGRDHLSAVLQLSIPGFGRANAHIHFGAPMLAGELLHGGGDAPVTRAVIAAMMRLKSMRPDGAS